MQCTEDNQKQNPRNTNYIFMAQTAIRTQIFCLIKCIKKVRLGTNSRVNKTGNRTIQ